MQFRDIEDFFSIKNRLVDIVNKNSIPHCQLFYGEEGGSSLAIALAFANYICCKNKDGSDSCGHCDGCNKIKAFIHPDLYFIIPTNITKEENANENINKLTSSWRKLISENPYSTIHDWNKKLSGAGKNMTIIKLDAHNLLKWLSMRSFEAQYKIVFIWLPEYMTISAANAFLKILEEPPLDTIFLLISNNKDKIIDTVLSRAQQIFICPFTKNQASQTLQNQFYIEKEEANKISKITNGNISKSLILIAENKKSSPKIEKIISFKDWMRFCYKKDFASLIQLAEQFQKYSSDDQKDFFKYSMNMIKAVYLIDLKMIDILNDISIDDKEFLEKLTKSFPTHHAKYLIESLDKACYYIDRNANGKMIFLNISLQINF